MVKQVNLKLEEAKYNSYLVKSFLPTPRNTCFLPVGQGWALVSLQFFFFFHFSHPVPLLKGMSFCHSVILVTHHHVPVMILTHHGWRYDFTQNNITLILNSYSTYSWNLILNNAGLVTSRIFSNKFRISPFLPKIAPKFYVCWWWGGLCRPLYEWKWGIVSLAGFHCLCKPCFFSNHRLSSGVY